MKKRRLVRDVPPKVSHSRDIALGALLLCALLIAYWPALQGGLLWDDAAHITKLELQSAHGLWRIWFDPGATQQYYPLTHTAFWIEHRIWGDSVVGYHLLNLLLHAAAAFLLVAIVRCLSLPGAWLAGFLFALHPVSVEAVAWISEQKSTLSAVFYLAAALAYFRFDRTRRSPHYAIASGFFALAVLSKTVAATLPAALLLIFWFKRGRIEWNRDARPLLPWFALAIAAGFVTAWVERNYIGAQGAQFHLSLVERSLIAGRAIWFYLGKLLWPANLMFTYPRWQVDAAAPWQYLFPIAALAIAAVLWLAARNRRGPLAGFLYFVGTLFPALGFFNVYPFLFSYVADHFQYLAMLGIIVPVASGLTRAAAKLPAAWRRFAPAPAAALVVILGTLTWAQSGMYRDAETLYRETLARNPDAWMAHNNLAILLSGAPERLPEVIAELQAALRIRPDYAEAHYNLGNAYAALPNREQDAIAEYQAALRIRPDYPEAHSNLGEALSAFPDGLQDAIAEYQVAVRLKPDAAELHNNLANVLARVPNRLPEAIAEYQAALRLQPDYAEAHLNLGSTLSTIPGRLPEAATEYREALRIRPGYAEAHYNLGSLLIDVPGRLPQAIAEFQAALRTNPGLAEAYYALGIALARSPGQTDEAIANLEQALRLRPGLKAAQDALDRLRR
jgi:tetratricopeptide (TPR) repeat protein